MQGFFRTFGLMFSSFDGAFRIAAFFVPNMIQYVGYMIPVDRMKRWLFWIVSAATICRPSELLNHHPSSTSTLWLMVRHTFTGNGRWFTKTSSSVLWMHRERVHAYQRE